MSNNPEMMNVYVGSLCRLVVSGFILSPLSFYEYLAVMNHESIIMIIA